MVAQSRQDDKSLPAGDLRPWPQESRLSFRVASIILESNLKDCQGERRKPMATPLDEFRQRLDTIDARVVALLSERAKVVSAVAEVKRQYNIPVYVPAREEAIITRLRTLNVGPLPNDAIERIYRVIIEEMRNFEHEHAS